MKNLKVSMKLILSFSMVILLACLVAVAGFWGMSRINAAAYDMYENSMMSISTLGLIRENFALQRNKLRELAIYEDVSEDFKEAEADLRNLEATMEEYIQEYAPDTKEDEIIFNQYLDAYYNGFGPYKTEIFHYASQNDTDRVMEIIRNEGTTLVKNISDILRVAYDMNLESAQISLNDNTSTYNLMTFVEIFVLSIVIIIVVLLIVYLDGQISAPLKRISSALDYMGHTGDLMLNDERFSSAALNAARGDEIGMASRAVVDLLNHIWTIEQAMTQISGGNFTVEVKTLSDRDTLGLSVSSVAENLNRMFNQMKEAEEAANAASKAKSAFLAHMSHEIRTPLNAIMGMSMILKTTAEDREKVLSSVDQIMMSSQHLLSILNDVLDMSKIESGKLELTHEPFRFRASFDEVFGIITQRCSEKKIRFTTNIDQVEDFTLIGDRMRINQVLINLLGNAVKFTEPFGDVSLTVEVLQESKHGVRLGYTISDTGIGMSKEQIERLFKPFEQGDSSIASRYGGTGLGLSISWNIVKMMGGTITVESAKDEGSTFRIEVFFEKGEPQAQDAEKAPETLDLHGKRLLLVEDIEINQVIICELLKTTGIMIEPANNGQQAVEMFTQSPVGYYDLIFMDIQMPVMDGYEATQRIRSMEREDAQSIPIVAMTANAYKEDVDKSLSFGMNGHLSKPIEYGVMLKMLREHIGSNMPNA